MLVDFTTSTAEKGKKEKKVGVICPRQRTAVHFVLKKRKKTN